MYTNGSMKNKHIFPSTEKEMYSFILHTDLSLVPYKHPDHFAQTIIAKAVPVTGRAGP
jgi:hypothetical protein